MIHSDSPWPAHSKPCVSAMPNLESPPLTADRGSASSAIVIGGSIAGLVAARVLLEVFDRVTVIERDRLPDEPTPRPGVPQSLHVHALLAQGFRLLEDLFPGIGDQLAAAGAVPICWTQDWMFYNFGTWAKLTSSDLCSYGCSRVLLEQLVRQRLTEMSGVTLLQEHQVSDLVWNDERSRVVGVYVQARKAATSATTSVLSAHLVVDASGRQSALPNWLQAAGYSTPSETKVNSSLCYGSRWYRYSPELSASFTAKGVTLGAQAGRNSRGGVLYPVEGDATSSQNWIVTLAGFGDDLPPTDDAGFLAFAASLEDPVIYNQIKAAEPLSPVYRYRRTENQWRHYETLPAMPDGVVALGDAVCAFNPVYGQGMTIATLGAETLRQTLHREIASSRFDAQTDTLQGMSLRFHKQLAILLKTPWLMATGEDFRWSHTTGDRPPRTTRWVQRYIDQVIAVAMTDAKTYRAFAQVMHLVKPPTTLFHPKFSLKVLGHRLRQAWRPLRSPSQTHPEMGRSAETL